jgi:hypothetical protein
MALVHFKLIGKSHSMGLNNLHEHGLIDLIMLCEVCNSMGTMSCSMATFGGTSQFLHYL